MSSLGNVCLLKLESIEIIDKNKKAANFDMRDTFVLAKSFKRWMDN